MATYLDVKKKLERVRFIESVLRETGRTRQDEIVNEILIDAKRDYRRALKRLAEQEDTKYFDCKDSNGEPYGDCWKEMYDVEYDGTKEELLAELDEQARDMAADVNGCGYDCTGKSFMTGFKVGHITGNRYRVLVGMALDVYGGWKNERISTAGSGLFGESQRETRNQVLGIVEQRELA